MNYQPFDSVAEEFASKWIAAFAYEGSDFSRYAFLDWYDGAEYAICKDCAGKDVMLLRAKKDGETFYWRPMSYGTAKDAMLLVDKGAVVAFATKDFADALDDNEYIKHTSGDDDEYVYLANEFIEMSGKRYHPKRNHIAKFSALYPSATLEKYSADDEKAVHDFALKWLEVKGEEEGETRHQSVERENEIVKNMLLASLEGKLIAAVLKVEGKVVGVSIAEITSSQTAICMYEKADIDYEGSYTYLAHGFAAKYLADCRWINRQEDMGIEGLRKSKLSYYPDHLLAKYSIVSVDAPKELKRLFQEENENFDGMDGYVQLKEDDYDATMAFLLDGIASLTDKRHFLNYTEAELKSVLSAGYMLAYVKDGAIAATCGIDFDKKYGDKLKGICKGKEDEPQYYEYSGIMVDSKLRHSGVGSALCKEVIAWAREHLSPCTLCAVVQYDNLPSLGNLTKLGFAERAQATYREFEFKYLTLRV